MNRLGMWIAAGLFVIGVLYLFITAYGMVITGLNEPITGTVLTVMEVLTLLTAPLLVILMAVIHAVSRPERRVYSTIAFGFMIIVAGLTSAVHFVGLTALKQTGSQLLTWPSPIYALELLAWDLFLGLALISSSFVYPEIGLRRKIRLGLILTGGLCLIGTSGPLTGDMRLQFIAVLGYGVFLPVVWLMMALDFQRSSNHVYDNAS